MSTRDGSSPCWRIHHIGAKFCAVFQYLGARVEVVWARVVMKVVVVEMEVVEMEVVELEVEVL